MLQSRASQTCGLDEQSQPQMLPRTAHTCKQGAHDVPSIMHSWSLAWQCKHTGRRHGCDSFSRPVWRNTQICVTVPCDQHTYSRHDDSQFTLIQSGTKFDSNEWSENSMTGCAQNPQCSSRGPPAHAPVSQHVFWLHKTQPWMMLPRGRNRGCTSMDPSSLMHHGL